MVAPECATLFIPPHLHQVELDVSRTELTVDYGLREGAQLSMRLPYEVKDARVGYRTLAGASYDPPYGDIHHRSETLDGIGDGELMVTFAPERLRGDRRRILVGAGLTLPFGHTEPDPIMLGMEGITHQHIQFGSGTFNPVLVARGLQYVARGAVEATLKARVPLYENDRGYEAPMSIDVATGPTIPFGRFALSALLSARYETVGEWNGRVDEGTGIRTAGFFLGGTFRLVRGVTVSPGVYQEIDSRGQHDETFEQGTTYSLAVTRTF